MPAIRCVDCGQPYPDNGVPFRCPSCGGVFDYDDAPSFSIESVQNHLPGYWRYRQTFGLIEGAPIVTLGEGNTPLLWEVVEDQPVALKMESMNPSGSYKDRGSAVLVSQLLGKGVSEAVEDSSGNAGASFAAYAARAGLRCRIYVPESASGPKRRQIEMYGADLIAVAGPRSEAARAVLAEAEKGVPYASHAYLPFGLMGIATIAYEVWEQLGRKAPGSIIAPVGHGGLLLGIVRGFSALKKAGYIERVPYYVGVQAAACDPVVRAFQHGLRAMETVGEGSTLAEGVRVRQPIRAKALLSEIQQSGGDFVAIDEREIFESYVDLGRRGLYVEPTSALVWAAAQKRVKELPQPAVVVISGIGLKYYPSN
jgi:threonine synthase